MGNRLIFLYLVLLRRGGAQNEFTKYRTKGGENIVKRIIFMMIMFAFLLSTNVQIAQASPILYLSTDGVTWSAISDGSIAPQFVDLNPASGEVTFIGTFSNWTVNVTTGSTHGGTSSMPYMDLCSINGSSAAGGDLWLRFSNDGYNYTGNIESAVGGTLGGVGTFYSYIDYSSPMYVRNSLSELGSYGPGAFSGSANALGSLTAADHTLDLVAHITHPRSSTGLGLNSSFNFQATAVPEPSTLLLLGSGIASLAFYARRRGN